METVAPSPAAPSAETQWIDLTLMDFPQDARVHTPEDLESLAEDMRINGQLQEIIVTPRAPHYEVVAGIGRVLAARQLNWEKIRCLIKEGLSEFDQLHITFSENEERENVSPIYQAKLLKKMKISRNFKDQNELAKNLGKSAAVLSQYLSLLDLEPAVQQKFDASNLTFRQLLELKRLPSADLQLQVAEECAKRDLSGKALKERVEQLAGTKPTLEHGRSGASAKKPHSETPTLPISDTEVDPLASCWAQLPPEFRASASIQYAEPNQWRFQIQAPVSGTKAALAKTLMALLKVLSAATDGVPADTVNSQASEGL